MENTISTLDRVKMEMIKPINLRDTLINILEFVEDKAEAKKLYTATKYLKKASKWMHKRPLAKVVNSMVRENETFSHIINIPDAQIMYDSRDNVTLLGRGLQSIAKSVMVSVYDWEGLSVDKIYAVTEKDLSSIEREALHFLLLSVCPDMYAQRLVHGDDNCKYTSNYNVDVQLITKALGRDIWAYTSNFAHISALKTTTLDFEFSGDHNNPIGKYVDVEAPEVVEAIKIGKAKVAKAKVDGRAKATYENTILGGNLFAGFSVEQNYKRIFGENVESMSLKEFKTAKRNYLREVHPDLVGADSTAEFQARTAECELFTKYIKAKHKISPLGALLKEKEDERLRTTLNEKATEQINRAKEMIKEMERKAKEIVEAEQEQEAKDWGNEVEEPLSWDDDENEEPLSWEDDAPIPEFTVNTESEIPSFSIGDSDDPMDTPDHDLAEVIAKNEAKMERAKIRKAKKLAKEQKNKSQNS